MRHAIEFNDIALLFPTKREAVLVAKDLNKIGNLTRSFIIAYAHKNHICLAYYLNKLNNGSDRNN